VNTVSVFITPYAIFPAQVNRFIALNDVIALHYDDFISKTIASYDCEWATFEQIIAI
jgi:hypothetical protein